MEAIDLEEVKGRRGGFCAWSRSAIARGTASQVSALTHSAGGKAPDSRVWAISVAFPPADEAEAGERCSIYQ